MPCNNQPQSLVSFSDQNDFSWCVCHLGHTFRLGSAVWFSLKLPVQVSWTGEWLYSLCPHFFNFWRNSTSSGTLFPGFWQSALRANRSMGRAFRSYLESGKGSALCSRICRSPGGHLYLGGSVRGIQGSGGWRWWCIYTSKCVSVFP